MSYIRMGHDHVSTESRWARSSSEGGPLALAVIAAILVAAIVGMAIWFFFVVEHDAGEAPLTGEINETVQLQA